MKIVICGGGTAGWLAALMIKKTQPDHDIVVIESSRIPIVGAGEGSTGYLTDIIQNNSWDYGCNEEDFIRETGATVKLGIKHRDWRHVGHTYYGPIDASDSSGMSPDVMFMWAKLKGHKSHLASRNGYLIEHNKSSFFKSEHIEPELGANTRSHSYHFDAHRVGQYFKKIVMACPGTTHIDQDIQQVVVGEHGITQLNFKNGETLTGDLYIDCTGFARVLTNALDIGWTSYNKNLPVNTAMPFLVKYKPGEKIEPVTTAWAQSSGWMWQIPTADRYGCGYVFDDNFITHKQAQREIETALGHEVEPIRFLKFDTGRLDKFWHKNCLALGLCAAFAEPLEATSIHATIMQLKNFIWDYLRDTEEDTNNFGSQYAYNKRTALMYDEFKEFLVLHYQTQRRDSEFWKYVTSGATITPSVEAVIEMAKHRVINNADFTAFHGYAGAGLWNWVLDGLGLISNSTVEKELTFWSVNQELTDWRWNAYAQTMEAEMSKMIDNTDFIKGQR